jgi:hypothetical protein
MPKLFRAILRRLEFRLGDPTKRRYSVTRNSLLAEVTQRRHSVRSGAKF